MNLLKKRNVIIALAAFIVGIIAVFTFGISRSSGSGAASAAQAILSRDTTINGQIASFILDDTGAVNGFVLTNGDQLRFGRNLGEALAANIKQGDEVKATGRAGTSSTYGREIRVRELNINGRTYVETAPAHPRPRHDAHKPVPPISGQAAPGIERHAPEMMLETIAGANIIENASVTSTVRTYLVGARGEANGMILQSGEQFRFPPHIAEEIAANINGGILPTNAQITVEGVAVQTPRGTVMRPSRLTIGDKTFALGR